MLKDAEKVMNVTNTYLESVGNDICKGSDWTAYYPHLDKSEYLSRCGYEVFVEHYDVYCNCSDKINTKDLENHIIHEMNKPNGVVGCRVHICSELDHLAIQLMFKNEESDMFESMRIHEDYPNGRLWLFKDKETSKVAAIFDTPYCIFGTYGDDVTKLKDDLMDFADTIYVNKTLTIGKDDDYSGMYYCTYGPLDRQDRIVVTMFENVKEIRKIMAVDKWHLYHKFCHAMKSKSWSSSVLKKKC